MNSTNIKVISEEIQRLKDQVHAIDVEVPDPSQATDGQILSVDEGKYVISDPEKELPATTEAATGDVLGLVGEAKTPGWITPFTPLDYSTTEQNLGINWVDGKPLYRKIFIDDFPSTAGTTYVDLGITGTIVYYQFFSSGGFYADNSATNFIRPTDNNLRLTTTDGNIGTSYCIFILYTKTPVPSNETKSTKKKTTTKKGE